MAEETVVTDAEKEAAAALLTEQNGDGKGKTTQEKPPTEESHEEHTEEESSFSMQSITKREDGKYELKVNDNTVYVGKDPDDIIKQLAGGKDKADKYIASMKKAGVRFQTKTKKGEEALAEGEDELQNLPAPDEDAIYRKHLNSQVRLTQSRVEGFEPKMVGWKTADWIKYEESFEVAPKPWQISKLQAAADAVIEKAQAAFNDEMKVENVKYVDFRNLTAEKEAIKEDLLALLSEMDIDESEFDYASMYDEAKKNRDKDGFIKPGSLSKAYYKQKFDILNSKSVVSKDMEEVKRKAAEARKKINEPPPGPVSRKQQQARHRSIDDVSDDVLKSIRSGG